MPGVNTKNTALNTNQSIILISGVYCTICKLKIVNWINYVLRIVSRPLQANTVVVVRNSVVSNTFHVIDWFALLWFQM